MKRARRAPLDPSVSVPAIVGYAHRGMLAARGTEAVLIGITVLTLGLAAAVLEGGALARGDSWAAAAILGLAAGATWWLGHRPSRLATARAIDRRLALRGELLTAFEAQRNAPEAGGLIRLLAARVGAQVTRREALRVALPRSGPAIAAPFVGAALLALALDGRAGATEAPGLEDLQQRLEEELGDARVLAVESVGRGEAEGATPADLARFASEVTRTLRSWERGELEPEEAAERIGELEDRLAELGAGVAPGSELAETLGRTGTLFDAARMQLEAATPRADAAGGGADESEGSGGASETGEEAGGLATGAGDGRMSGSPGADGRPTEVPAAVESTPEVGAATASWAREYDEVVTGWMRRLQDTSPSGRDER